VPGTPDGVIVVAGEALIDLVPAEDGALSPHAGGGPYNAARTIGRLERPVAFLGRLSTDRFGRLLRQGLADDGVVLEAIVETEDPTTLAVAELDTAGAATYRFYVDSTSAPGLTPSVAAEAMPRRASVLHVGTLGLVFEPTAEAIEALVAAVDDETLVFVDPNCRPSAIRDPDTYRARLGRILRRSDVVKVSDDDLRWLEPGLAPLDAARGLLRSGPSVALLTRGAHGAAAVTVEAVSEVPAPPTSVVDTIGAGDAFGGGFVAWWHRAGLRRADLRDDGAVREATRVACLVAARTCARAGAVPPRLSELDGEV